MEERYEDFVDPVDGTRWHVDLAFLGSSWTCIWGAGCPGILDHPAPELGQGCCSVGAEVLDEDEAMRITALAATLSPERFRNHDEACVDGVLRSVERSGGRGHSTRIVDGACIFHNPPDFAGGSGCALHLGALDDGDDPMEWKPSVCWQLPLKVEREGDVVRLRRWRREDWGSGGADMAWCCTEAPDAYRGAVPVSESLEGEIRALVGPEVFVAIRSRLGR